MKQDSYMKTFINGLLTENPTFVLFLGMCPTLAVTTGVINAIGMGLSTTAVLICSNIVISLLRNFIPDKIRIAGYIVIIAGFVTIVQMLMNAYVPSLASSLGIYIPLIVVNCIILGRAEAFANKNGLGKSAVDGIGMGLGFTCALTLIAAVREILGAGTFAGISLFGSSFQPVSVMILPPGAFLTLGCLLAVINIIAAGRKKKAAKAAADEKEEM
ncbi:MAG: electron transport complex subunit E [Clostridiales bacterium]|nr:electron transport complex subunit E [Clostridiales bacterium]